MITVKSVVEAILESNIEIQNTLSLNLLNTTQYAKKIQKEVEKKTKKTVSTQTIVVTLLRLKRKLKAYDFLPEIAIRSVSLHTPIVKILFEKNTKNLESILHTFSTLEKTNDSFFALSTSNRDIVVIASESLEDRFTENYSKIKRNLCAISLRFKEEYVEEAGVGYSLMHKIATRNIILDEVFSTHNEFTLVLEKKYLSKTLELFQ